MLHVAVLSDTHIPEQAKHLPKSLLKKLAGVDQIWHAGDCTSREVLNELATLAPVVAVRGNMDLGLGELPLCLRFKIAELRVVLLHGHGYSRERLHQELVRAHPNADIIVYGHTHSPFWGKIGEQWLLNPGSPLDASRAGQASFGMLEIDHDQVQGEIVRVQ